MTDQHQHRASINLNDDVKVKLTDYGRDLLAKKRLTRQPDEAGYIKFQLWELMNIFGSYVCNGCSIPCNGCSIPFTFNRILLAPFNPAMTDQLRARVEALEARYETQRQATLEWSKNVARWIMELEAGQKTKPSPAVDRVLALQDQIRDGSLTLAKALKKINGDDQPVQQFIPKYLFTASDILQDSFLFNFDSSVLFDLCINGEQLAPGDGIKIAHRLGEVPASGVYSTINYKVASVSKVDDGVWTVRAVRVDTSDSEPAPTADDQLTLVDRVANALYSVPEPAGGVRSLAAYSVALPAAEARAAIREVAKWLRSEYPLLTLGTAAWANLLDNEANR